MTRDGLLRRLRCLLEVQFEELLFRLSVRKEYLPAASAPLLTRALDLIRYLETQDRLVALEQAIDSVIAGNESGQRRTSDLDEWHGYLEVLQRQVCRIDIRDTRMGTGFLVGPDVVVTAFTAVQQLVRGEVSPGEVSFRFDLWSELDGRVPAGVAYRLAEPDWLIEHSPPEHLNFAVLRLFGLPRGGERLGAVVLGSRGRGYIQVPDVQRPCPMGATLFLVHHPGDGAIRLSMSCYAVKSVARHGRRLSYAIAADRGSIGGPVFDATGALVAIHEGIRATGTGTSIAWNAIL